jgi:hypothetical protein
MIHAYCTCQNEKVKKVEKEKFERKVTKTKEKKENPKPVIKKIK